MRLNLTVKEAIYILNRLKGREIVDMAELMFKMYNTKKLDENHKVLQTVRERLVEAFGEDDVINVVPHLDDFHGIMFDFYIKTEK